MLELENSTKAKAWVKYSWAFLFRDEFLSLYENYKEDMNMEIKEFYKKYNLNKYTFTQFSNAI